VLCEAWPLAQRLDVEHLEELELEIATADDSGTHGAGKIPSGDVVVGAWSPFDATTATDAEKRFRQAKRLARWRALSRSGASQRLRQNAAIFASASRIMSNART
jgi:hypothetical protein